VSGFAGTINLSVSSESGFPSGITSGGFTHPSVVRSGSSKLTIDTTTGTIPYALSLTVTGTSGTVTHAASTTLLVNLAPPAHLSAKEGDTKVSLSWPASVGASYYHAKRATFPDGPYQTLACVAETSYIDVNVVNGITYHYVIDAGYSGGPNAGGESADSHEANATPKPN
jgi:fibronectin type 3 domain-containing protein